MIALVRDGVAIEIDFVRNAREGWSACPPQTRPGWRFDGESWSPPAPPPPPVPGAVRKLAFAEAALQPVGSHPPIISPAEFEAWMRKGELPALVTTVIGQQPEAAQPILRGKAAAMTDVPRHHPFIMLLQAHLRWTDAEVDELFIRAATL